MANVGLLFGSFNPIHHGHLLLATHMREAAELDEIWLVVSPQNPFKQMIDLVDENHRLQMAELATINHEFINVCSIEFQLDKPSYTYITLEELKNKYPEHIFKLIIGGDNVSNFKEWKNAEWISKSVEILVYNRGTTLISTDGLLPEMKLYNLPLLDISSTFIRKRIADGLSIRYFVPENVKQYIMFHKLFNRF